MKRAVFLYENAYSGDTLNYDKFCKTIDQIAYKLEYNIRLNNFGQYKTAGRAARQVNGRVIFYANKITKSMQATIDETTRRRTKQLKYNEDNNITPQSVIKSEDIYLAGTIDRKFTIEKEYILENRFNSKAAEEMPKMMNQDELLKKQKSLRKELEVAVKALDFIKARDIRDEIRKIEDLIGKYDN